MSKGMWRVVGWDTFAREDYFIGSYPTRELAEAAAREAERRVAYQDEALRDQISIIPPEEEAETQKPGA